MVLPEAEGIAEESEGEEEVPEGEEEVPEGEEEVPEEVEEERGGSLVPIISPIETTNESTNINISCVEADEAVSR